MTIQVIGVGLPRTGTASLKRAIEQILSGKCYHMYELAERSAADLDRWEQALGGDIAALESVLDGWCATVDWPGAVLWQDLVGLYPDAHIVLSERSSEDVWWASIMATIGRPDFNPPDHDGAEQFVRRLRSRAGLTKGWQDESSARELYRSTGSEVRRLVSPEKLLCWTPEDGWEPLCNALRRPVPDIPFPQENSSYAFRMQGEARPDSTQSGFSRKPLDRLLARWQRGATARGRKL